MKLLVGLGNPGNRYHRTRHNAGFVILDRLVAEAGGVWSTDQKLQAEVARGQCLGVDCFLLKPLTFMNLSGRSVGSCLRFFKILPGDMVVLHDDIDLPAGKVRSRVGGGHGGHNGIRSILDVTGGVDFFRIKLGFGRPPENWDTADWVLQNMSQDEWQYLNHEMFIEVKSRLKQIFEASKLA